MAIAYSKNEICFIKLTNVFSGYKTDFVGPGLIILLTLQILIMNI